jgi:hypothetical protein
MKINKRKSPKFRSYSDSNISSESSRYRQTRLSPKIEKRRSSSRSRSRSSGEISSSRSSFPTKYQQTRSVDRSSRRINKMLSILSTKTSSKFINKKRHRNKTEVLNK